MLSLLFLTPSVTPKQCLPGRKPVDRSRSSAKKPKLIGVPAVPCGSEGPLPETKTCPGGGDHKGPQCAEESLEKGEAG